MLSCREVTEILGTDSLGEISWHRRLGVWLHLLLCRHCRRYARQLRSIRKVAHGLWNQTPEERRRLAELERTILRRSAETGRGNRDTEP